MQEKSVKFLNIFKFYLEERDSLKRQLIYEVSKPQSGTTKINFGFMSTIVYDGGLRPKLIFINKISG